MLDAGVFESAAITVVFAKGSIFKWLRSSGPEFWQELAGCPLCAGVWIGAGWRLLHAPVVDSRVAWDALASGAETGVLALLLVLLLALLDKHS